jgi:DNA mismatch repair protein MutL
VQTEPKKPQQKEKFVTMTAEEYVREYVRGGMSDGQSGEKKAEPIAPTPVKDEKPETVVEQKEVSEPASTVAPEAVPEIKAEPLSHRIIGEAFNAYVIVERGEEMLLIDKHAAHERIIFEELKAAMKNASPTSQMLMLPLEIMMTSEEIQTIEQYRKEIEATGFEFAAGRYSVSVSAIPEGIGTDAVSDMLVVMAERLRSGTGTADVTRDIVFEKALYQASCKAAIKAGREYATEHIKWIVDKLMAIPDITVCPHGRPVAMELSKKNLDRQFERT